MTEAEFLLVAADRTLTETVQAALRGLGHVEVSNHADEATLYRARAHPIAVLLLEIGIANITPEWLTSLRSICPDAILVLLCSREQLPQAAEFTRFEVAEIVITPVPTVKLHDAVSRALQRRRSHREVARLQALVPLYEMSRMFMLHTNLDELLNRVLETAVNETSAQRGSIMLIDENRQIMTIQAAVGIPMDVVLETKVTLGEGIAGWVAKTGEALVVNKPDDLPEFLRQSMRGGALRSSLSMPLATSGKVIGVLNLTKLTMEDPFVAGDAELLSVLVGQAAVAITNARLIKQMEAAYEELSRLEHLKTEFINIAAHELRTPVSVIMGYAGFLLDMAPDDIRELVEPLSTQAQQLQRIVDDLFNLDYLKSLRQLDPELNIAPLNLTEVARAAVREATPVAQARELELRLITTEDIKAIGDERYLRRVLRHLIDNALKFTPAGGYASVAITIEGGEAYLRVQDTGPGVPPEERERIFAPFYQTSPSLRRSHGGMGLGLSLARRMMQVQGGRLWLEPRTGPGASFCLALPLAEPNINASSAQILM